MKLAFPLLVSATIFMASSAHAQQDTATRKQDPNSHSKTQPKQNNGTSTTPASGNKIAVSDPGVPMEKGKSSSTTRNKGTNVKPEEKKKQGTVTPK